MQSIFKEFANLTHLPFYELFLFFTQVPFILDVANTFDSVIHKSILHKLYNFGFRGSIFTLLESVFFFFFLSRPQIAFVFSFKSTRVIIKFRVPQGSVLFHVLFNICVSVISAKVFTCNVFQYHDDILLFSRHFNYEHTLRLLCRNAAQVMNCFDDNLITVNTYTPKMICFRKLRIGWITTCQLFYTNLSWHSFECSPLVCVESVKYLGYFCFYSDMLWNLRLSLLQEASKCSTFTCSL